LFLYIFIKDEETLVDSAWSKFCEIKGNIQKKPEYKKAPKEEVIIYYFRN